MARTRGAILVVDDEPDIRALLGTCLSAAGYVVYDAADASEALVSLAAHADVRLVLTDIVMPGSMSGVELAEAIAQRHPGLEVVFMSGYVPPAKVALAQRMLRKPFRTREVLDTVARALAQDDNGA